jgi:Fur family transcriptional regulator, ferric uptake regulator
LHGITAVLLFSIKIQQHMNTLQVPPEILLKDYGIYITEPRKKVLETFLMHTTALTQDDIRRHCQHSIDKVTIYRTLLLFVQMKIIHILPSTDYVVRYTLLSKDSSSFCQHLHFICEGCNKTYCLHHLKVPELQLPAGYFATETNLVIKGLCNHCSTIKNS